MSAALAEVVSLATASANASPIGTLAPALLQTFSMIGLGYLLSRFHIMPTQGARALSLYVSMLAYPAMVFYTLTNLDFSQVMWRFFFVILLARVIIALFAIGFNFFRHGISPETIANSGIFGIFTSQSNDLVMGVGIMQAVFESSHPTWKNMLYIVALTRVLINPFGFYMMEYGRMKSYEAKQRELDIERSGGGGERRVMEEREKDKSGPSYSSGGGLPGAEEGQEEEPYLPQSQFRTTLRIMRRVLINPLVLSTTAGVLANYIFSGRMPGLIDPFFRRLGDSFNSTALFVLGMAMNGHLDKLNDRSQLQTPLWLFTLKSIILPILSRGLAAACGLEPDLILFAFILGTLPSSEQVPFFAYDYLVPARHLMAPAMVLGTVLAAPVMFIAAQMVNITLDSASVDDILVGTMRIFSAFGIFFACYFLLVLWYNKRYTEVRDRLLILLVIAQLTLNLSSEFCGLDGDTTPGGSGVRFAIVFTARMATRCLILALAVNELIRLYGFGKEKRWFLYLLLASATVSISIMTLTVIGGQRTISSLQYSECFFRYGRFEWMLLVGVDAFSFLMLTVIFIALWRRSRKEDLRGYYHPISQEDGIARGKDSDKEEDDEGKKEKKKKDGTIATSPEGGRTTATTLEPIPSDTEEEDGDGPDPSPQPSFYDNIPTHQHRPSNSFIIVPPTPGNSAGLMQAPQPGTPAAASSSSSSSSSSSTHPYAAPFTPSSQSQSTPRQSTLTRRSSWAASRRPSSSHSLSPEEALDRENSWQFGMYCFLILSILWMIINMCLSIWSVSARNTTSDLSEGRLELLLLDGVMSGGQSIWTWMAFGLASHVRSPFMRATKWIQHQGMKVMNWRGS